MIADLDFTTHWFSRHQLLWRLRKRLYACLRSVVILHTIATLNILPKLINKIKSFTNIWWCEINGQLNCKTSKKQRKDKGRVLRDDRSTSRAKSSQKNNVLIRTSRSSRLRLLRPRLRLRLRIRIRLNIRSMKHFMTNKLLLCYDGAFV